MPELSPLFDATELTLALELLDELDCDEQQASVEDREARRLFDPHYNH